MTFPCWQSRRSRFNHDWLKNQFLPALDNFLNILDGRVEDEETEATFIASVLPIWETHRTEAHLLPADFERCMSPRTLFERPPLSRCDEETRCWLGDLIHKLWLARYMVGDLVANASARAREVDDAYIKLQQGLEECKSKLTARELRPLRPLFGQFRQACYRLALSIERFPNKVLVT